MKPNGIQKYYVIHVELGLGFMKFTLKYDDWTHQWIEMFDPNKDRMNLFNCFNTFEWNSSEREKCICRTLWTKEWIGHYNRKWPPSTSVESRGVCYRWHRCRSTYCEGLFSLIRQGIVRWHWPRQLHVRSECLIEAYPPPSYLYDNLITIVICKGICVW